MFNPELRKVRMKCRVGFWPERRVTALSLFLEAKWHRKFSTARTAPSWGVFKAHLMDWNPTSAIGEQMPSPQMRRATNTWKCPKLKGLFSCIAVERLMECLFEECCKSLLLSSAAEPGAPAVRNGMHSCCLGNCSALEHPGVLPGKGRFLALKFSQAGGILLLLETSLRDSRLKKNWDWASPGKHDQPVRWGVRSIQESSSTVQVPGPSRRQGQRQAYLQHCSGMDWDMSSDPLGWGSQGRLLSAIEAYDLQDSRHSSPSLYLCSYICIWCYSVPGAESSSYSC